MRFPETKIRGTTWTVVKGLRTPRRKIPGKFTREQAKVSKLKNHRGSLTFRCKDVTTEDGKTRRVRLSQPRCWRDYRPKREKYPHRRFWASRTFTVTWVESYLPKVSEFFKSWLAALHFPPLPIEPGGLIPVSVDGMTSDAQSPAIIEWQTQYGTPPTLH